MSDMTKEEYVVEYIKALQTVEEEMEPYKEHKRDLRANYAKNGWLSKATFSKERKLLEILTIYF